MFLARAKTVVVASLVLAVTGVATPAQAESDPRPKRIEITSFKQEVKPQALTPVFVDTQTSARQAPAARKTKAKPYSRYKYKTKRVKVVCSSNFCVHYALKTKDKASRKQAKQTLKALERSRKVFHGQLKFKKPVAEAGRRRDGRIDVSLRDLSKKNAYGLAHSEYYAKGTKKRYSGWLSIENDFKDQSGANRGKALRTTAAHEYFHLIQYNYPTAKDSWLLEPMAKWSEDQVFPNDNFSHLYVNNSQYTQPFISLNTQPKEPIAFHYGNWIFYQYLSEHYGIKALKAIMSQGKGTFPSLEKALQPYGGLPAVYANFAISLNSPQQNYQDGAYFPVYNAPAFTLTSQFRRAYYDFNINHLASDARWLRPDPAYAGQNNTLTISVQAPAPGTNTLVAVQSYNNVGVLGPVQVVPVDASGRGAVRVGFDYNATAGTIVRVINASPTADAAAFHVDLTVQ